MKNSKKRILLKSIIVITAALFASAGYYIEVNSSSVVPILMYHSFDADGGRSLSLNVDPKVFEYQMEFFAKNKYNVVGPDKIIAYMTKKERMPAKTVSITADDGYFNFYDKAYPVLKKHNLPATIFIVTDKIGRQGYLGWKELREMSDSGLVTIGSHTKSHPWLPSVSVDREKLHDELAVSKKILEEGLGEKIDYLCYPNGGFNDMTKETAREYGYKGAFTTNPDKRSAIDDIYAIRRIKMSSSSNKMVVLWGKVSRYYAWFKEQR